MAARPKLRAVLGGASEEEARFCGRCGHPPAPGTVRVCRRCGDGLVLSAPAGGAPAPGDAFLVVDRALTVRAVSAAAEREVGMPEAEALGLPLDGLLEGDGARGRLRAMPCGTPRALLVVLGPAGPSPA